MHRQLAPEIKGAAWRGDLATVKALYTRLFERHIQLCPSSYSPRIVDADYRTRFLDYYSGSMTVHDTDPRVVSWTQYMNQRIQELRQTQMMQGAVVSFGLFAVALGAAPQQLQFPDQAFWAVYQAFRSQLATLTQAVTEAGVLAKYPDDVTANLIERVGISAFVQGWLPYISVNVQQHLIQDAGLRDQYVEVQPPPLQLRRCGGCGGQLDVVTGARRVICFRCGKKVEVAGHEFPCPGCGAPSSVPAGSTAYPCPYCGVRIQGTTAPTAGSA
ncbi:MAG: hypothetical protein R3B13_11475 [Polyangiaceae bacterium]